nr:pyocin activator PrtN family protein [Xenorhabdus ishibashii]
MNFNLFQSRYSKGHNQGHLKFNYKNAQKNETNETRYTTNRRSKSPTTERKANKGKLKIQTYKMNDSQKSPRIVHVHDLASILTGKENLPQKKWKKYSRRKNKLAILSQNH